MELKKKITLTIHIPPRKSEPLSEDERKQLANFFMAIMNLRPDKDIRKGKNYDAYK